MPADWQLPPGVSRGLWDYLHDADTARRYDERLADTPLLNFDRDFVVEHCQPIGSIIDLGCGTGRLCLTLAPLGYRPIAVDLSAEMLKVVGERAAQAHLEVPRVQANLVELGCFADNSFDHAACLFQTLGMIAGAAERKRALAHIYRIVRPGGVFVLHVHNRWHHLATRGGRRLLCRNAWDALRGRSAWGDFTMPPNHGVGAMPMHLFSRREIRGLLREVGFVIREVRPISVANDGRMSRPWLFGGCRAYGFLIAAMKR